MYVLTLPGGLGRSLGKSDAGQTGMAMIRMGPGTNVTLTAAGVDMATFLKSTVERSLADRPALDKTGLTGRYDGKLVYSAEVGSAESKFGGPEKVGEPEPMDFRTALLQQWGIKVTATKAPVDVLVVDKMETPSEN